MLNSKIILALIIIVALVLRFWQLGNVPISPDWDEAALGYNAYSILTTGRDEYGELLPVMLKSFGDYKPVLYAYTAIPTVFLFGLDTFAVRFPSAFFGTLSVLLTFFLVKELVKNNKIALISAFLLAISPWHIQFSRVAFEANLGVFLNLATVLFFVKGLKKPYLLLFAAATSALSLYSYQSEKIFAPILMLILLVIFRKELLSITKKYLSAFFVIGLLIAFPMIFSTIQNPDSLNRARSTSFISDHEFFPHTANRLLGDVEKKNYLGFLVDNRRTVFIRQSLGAYLSHYNPNWLFITGDLSRHHVPNMGLLYFWEVPFLLIGLYFLIFTDKIARKSKLLILLWFLAAPIPAAVTNDVPHAVRTLNFLPTFQIITSVGIFSVYVWLRQRIKNQIFVNGLILTGGVIFVFNLAFYLNQYFVQQNYFYSKDWQYGYEQTVLFLDSKKDNYEKIVVSNDTPLDQSYIFFLFYQKFSPKKYQQSNHDVISHNFENFEFRRINWEDDKFSDNTLFVGRPSDFSGESKILKEVKYLNGETAIKIVEPL